MRSSKTIVAFATDPIFETLNKPTRKMVARAKFWSEWKKRQEAKQKGEKDNGSKVQDSTDSTGA